MTNPPPNADRGQTFSLSEAALYLRLNVLDAQVFLLRYGIRSRKGIPVRRVEEIAPHVDMWWKYHRRWKEYPESNPRNPRNSQPRSV